MDPELIVINAAILGLLIGIVWSLKYIVLIERRIAKMENNIARLLERKRR